MTQVAGPSSFGEQLRRRKPIAGLKGPHAGPELERSFGTFQLTMFGVGATVGTGIFFVLQEAVPDAGPAVIISFLVAGLGAGLSAICYAEMASAIPVSGSTYSYAYHAWASSWRWSIAACVLLEYGVSRRPWPSAGAATSTSCSRTCSASTCPTRCRTRPIPYEDDTTGIDQPAGRRAGPDVHGAADPRRQRVRQGEHR